MSEATTTARFSREFYERDAIAYLDSLPLEHFMESERHSMQRQITLAALDVVAKERADVHLYNEMLIQYPLDEPPYFGRVCPDNMVVIYDGPLEADMSYVVEHLPVPPVLVIEYASKKSADKDYEVNYLKYERELVVLYYLLYDLNDEDFTLFKLHPRTMEYVPVKADRRGRCAIPELELELVLHDSWLRYLFRGEFMEMTGDLYQMYKTMTAKNAEITAMNAEITAKNAEISAKNVEISAKNAEITAKKAEVEAENERLRAIIASLGGGE